MSILRLSAFLVLFTLSTNVVCGTGTDKHPRSKPDGSAHESRLTKKVRKIAQTINKESKKAVHCIISVTEELAETFESLLCLHTENDRYDVMTFVGLGDALQRLTIHPEPPPAYTPSYCPEHLKPLNPVLWERLGLDSLPVTSRCINGITSQYSVRVDILRNKLSHQDSSLELPYVDVHLQDISGSSFSLSELPFEWLQSPEIVNHIEEISPANKEYRLRRVAKGISLARKLAKNITTKASLKKLRKSATRAWSAAGDLNSFRCEDMDFIGLSISQDGRNTAMKYLYKYGKIEPKEQHLVISLGKRERNTNATYRLYATLSRLRKKASDIVTPSGNLMAWALANDASCFALAAITDTYGYHTPVTLENLLTLLQKEPVSRRADDLDNDNYESTSLLLHTLFKQNVGWKRKLQGQSTRVGTLVDYVQHERLADYWVLYSLYEDAKIKATEAQLLKAIKQSSKKRGDKRIPWFILNKLKKQRVNMKRWRSQKGENLAEYAYNEGAPVKVVNDMYFEKNTGPFVLPLPSFFYQQHQAKDSGTRPSINKESWQFLQAQQTLQPNQRPFVVNDPEQYLVQASGFLARAGYEVVDVPDDDRCFLHALAGMLDIPEHMVKRMLLEKLIDFLNKCTSGAFLDEAETELLSWVGVNGLQQAILDLDNDGWIDAHLAPLVAYALFGALRNFTGFYLISPNSQSLPAMSHILPNGAVLPVENIPPDSAVLIFNGVNHFMYASTMMNTQADNVQEELAKVVKGLIDRKPLVKYFDSGK